MNFPLTSLDQINAAITALTAYRNALYPVTLGVDNPAVGQSTTSQMSASQAEQALFGQHVAAAPVTPPPAAATPVTPPADSDTDSAGVVWSAELHASSKAKNADGTWRKKRGAADVPAPPVTAAAAPVTPPPVAAAPVTPPPVAATPVTPPPPAAAAPGRVTAEFDANGNPVNHLAFMQAVGKLRVAGKVTPDQINASLANFGASSLIAVGQMVDMIPAIWADIQASV